MLLLIGAVTGLLSVIVGTVAEHVLHPHLNVTTWGQIQTAIQYQQLSAIIMVILGLALINPQRLTHAACIIMQLSGWLFFAGSVLFSLMIELTVSFSSIHLFFLAPSGGFAFCLGWLGLIVSATLQLLNKK